MSIARTAAVIGGRRSARACLAGVYLLALTQVRDSVSLTLGAVLVLLVGGRMLLIALDAHRGSG